MKHRQYRSSRRAVKASLKRQAYRGLFWVGTVVALAVCCLFLGSTLLPGRAGEAPPTWQWISCDVGQGDAHLIRAGDRSAYLLDTGEDAQALASCLKWAGVDTVEALIITHAHADHYGAYAYVLDTYEPKHVVVTHQFDTSKTPGISEKNNLTRLSAGSQGATRIAGRHSEALGEVLWPPHHALPIEDNQDINNSSLVIRWQIPAVAGDSLPLTVLSTGDLEADAAHRLLTGKSNSLDAHVLKIPHHGASGSGTDIISASSPDLALIPVGANNSYGHPHPDITDFLLQRKIPTVRTDQSGHIAVTHTVGGLSVSTSS